MSTDKNYSATNDHAQEPGQEEPEYMQLARQDTQPPPQVESVQQAQARTQAQQYPGLPGAPETASNKLMPYQGTLVAIQLIRVILESLPLALLVVVIVSSFFKTYGPPQASRRAGEEIAVLPAVAVLAVEVALCVIMIVAAQKTLNNRAVAKAAIYYSNI